MRRTAILSLGLLALAGCGSDGPYQSSQGAVRTLRTTAESRLALFSTPQDVSPTGVVTPRQIACLEPSPDVMKAVSSAVAAGLSGSGQGTNPQTQTQLQVELALALSRSRAESTAQLTERLATVQLLRDGLYRACEAYAMGALGSISYAMMLSRYGSIMITMLGSELAAGAFGRQLATLGGAAGGDARSANGVPGGGAPATGTGQERITQLEGERTGLVTQIAADRAKAESTSADVSADAKAEAANLVQGRQQRITQIDAELGRLKAQGARDVNAAATTNATATAVGGGGIAGRSAAAAGGAEMIARLQEQYFDATDLSPLMVACITALQRVTEQGPERQSASGPTPVPAPSMAGSNQPQNVLYNLTRLARECEGDKGLLRTAIASAAEAGKLMEARRTLLAQAERDRAAAELAKANADARRAELALLQAQATARRAGATP